MVPKGWKETTLGEILTFKNGLNFSKSSSGENIKIVGVKDFKDLAELKDTSTLESIQVESKIRDAELLRSGDLLFVRSNGNKQLIGRCLFFPSVNERLSFSGFTIRGRVSDGKTLQVYASHLVRSELIKSQFSKNGAGTNISNLSQDVLSQATLNLPPTAEQTKIARILSTWDKVIATTERQLANSQQQKQALMQQLLTGQKRFAEFRDQWNHQQLGDIATIVMGSSPRSESYNGNGLGLPLLQGNADIDNRRSSPRIFTSQITKECNPGDILLSVRAPVGHVALSAHHACIGRGIAGLLAHKEHDQSFLYQWLIWFEPQWESISQGSTFESVNSNDIRSLKVMTPPLPEQQKIAQVLSTADAELTNLQAQLAKLKLEKKALMQQLLTGQRRVKLDADAAA